MKLAVREIEVDSIEQNGGKEIRERGKIVTLIIWVFLLDSNCFRSQIFPKCRGDDRETQP